MTVQDVIESYVTDVAVQLPRKQRNDVAFELRALLNEGLQDRAEAEGRAADEAMAIEFVRAFGRPAEVASRYRPTLTIIDPADAHNFRRATIIGLAIIWGASLLQRLQHPMGSGWEFLQVYGQWWGSVLIPSLWWPGVLVVGFAASSWARGRWPQKSQWQPREPGRIPGSPAALVLGILGIVCALFVLTDPTRVLTIFFGGRIAPAAYEAFTYSDAFRWHQGLALVVLLALNIPLLIVVIASGRWTARTRNLETVLGLATCAVMLWSVFGGPIYMNAVSDRIMKSFMVLIAALTVIRIVVNVQRSVRPAPSKSIGADPNAAQVAGGRKP
jgi:hypothetical protein